MLLAAACSVPHEQEADACNDKAYAFHYRNLDSVGLYARRAYGLAKRYDAGRAEALNNLAFADLMKMRFTEAYARLDSVLQTTDNQVELLVADIQLMRLCQRESLNKEFYDYYEKAQKRLHRIEEDERLLSDRQRRRMVYARTEFAIVTSTYYYYVGLEQPSVRAIRQINPDGEIQTDMAQLLAYYYNIGAGGIITTGTQAEISQREFDYLMHCYMLARRHGYPYWEANSLQALSEHLVNDRNRRTLMRDNLLAGNLAQRSLAIFRQYGDVYQTAGSYRTLASCYWQIKDYRSAILCLQKALNSNPAIRQAPDLVASIREQLSVAYSAINDKQQSDYNRNIYLDLQDETRQDRYLASRAEQLDRTSQQLNLIIAAVALSIFIVFALLVLFHYLRRRRDSRQSLDELLVPLEQWRRQNEIHRAEVAGRYDETAEQLDLNRIHLVDNRRKNLEQRAKVSLVNSVIPLIDRMLHEIAMLKKGGESDTLKAERYTYIRELTDKINELNAVLTEWIQLRQGRLSLHIESFPVQQVFDIVKKGRMGFQMKGIDLRVADSTAIVKADRVLTLFMVNTLADNARKFTPAGGSVTVSAAEGDGYVEISVADTGCGLTETQQAHIFDYKPIHDQTDSTSHGFGLMNCNGIINKYRKISRIFSVCRIGVESREGRGSRFFFRLPKGIGRTVVGILLAVCPLAAASERPARDIDKAAALARHDYGTLAGIYADSAYFSNINGSYAQTLAYADTCRSYLNRLYLRLRPKGADEADGDPPQHPTGNKMVPRGRADGLQRHPRHPQRERSGRTRPARVGPLPIQQLRLYPPLQGALRRQVAGRVLPDDDEVGDEQERGHRPACPLPAGHLPRLLRDVLPPPPLLPVLSGACEAHQHHPPQRRQRRGEAPGGGARGKRQVPAASAGHRHADKGRAPRIGRRGPEEPGRSRDAGGRGALRRIRERTPAHQQQHPRQLPVDAQARDDVLPLAHPAARRRG